MATKDEWAKAKKLLAAPAALSFRQLRAVAVASGQKSPRNREEAEAAVVKSDLESLNQDQKNAVLESLGIRQPKAVESAVPEVPTPETTPTPEVQKPSAPVAPVVEKPKVTEPQAKPEDPEKKDKKASRRPWPWWVWLILVVALLKTTGVFDAVIGSKPSAIEASLQEKLDQANSQITSLSTQKTELEAKLDEVQKTSTDNTTGDQSSKTGSDVPVVSTEPPAEEPAAPAVGGSFDPYAFVPVGYEPQFVDRSTRVWHHYRLEVNKNGENDQAALVVTNNLDFLLISRVVPDDQLIAAWCIFPDSDQKIDISSSLAMTNVPAGGTGDAAQDVWFNDNEVNIKEGELLLQNGQVVYFKGPIPAGFACYFHVQDDVELGVNVGLDILTGGNLPATRVVEINP